MRDELGGFLTFSLHYIGQQLNEFLKGGRPKDPYYSRGGDSV
jgi:hypothetical protein